MTVEADRRVEDAKTLCTLGEEAFGLVRELILGRKAEDIYESWGSMAVGIREPWINLQLMRDGKATRQGMVIHGKNIRSLWLEPKVDGYNLVFHEWDGLGFQHYEFTANGVKKYVRGANRFTNRINRGEREIVAQAMVILRDRLQSIWDQPKAA